MKGHGEYCTCRRCFAAYGQRRVSKSTSPDGPSKVIQAVVEPDEEPEPEGEVISVGKDIARVNHEVKTRGEMAVSWTTKRESGIPLSELEDFVHQARANGCEDDAEVKYATRQVTLPKKAGEDYAGYGTGHVLQIDVPTVMAYASTAKPRKKRIDLHSPKTYVKPAAYAVGGVMTVGAVALLWNLLWFFLEMFT
jgi:hypothetical protein